MKKMKHMEKVKRAKHLPAIIYMTLRFLADTENGLKLAAVTMEALVFIVYAIFGK